MNKDYPERWKPTTIREVCEKTMLTNPTRQPEKYFQYIDISSVSNASFQIVDTKSILGKDAPSRARKLVKAGDIIFATVRPTLKRVAMIPAHLDGEVCSTGFCVLRANRQLLDESFLYFYLLTEYVSHRVDALQKGATYPAISDADLLGENITLPPLREQRAIASVLCAIQSAIQARREELLLHYEYKAALQQYLLTRGIHNESRKNTEIGTLPMSWKVVKLGDIVRHPVTDGVHKTPEYVAEGVPFVSARDIQGGEITFENCPRITPEAHSSLTKRVRPEYGDVLLTKVGATIGKLALVTTANEFSIFVQIALIKPKLDEIDPRFLQYVLQSEQGQREIMAKSSQSTMPFIGTQKVALIQVPLPPLVEQFAISEKLQACDVMAKSLRCETVLLEELFRAMLENLMTGQLSVLSLVADNLQ